MKLKLPSALIGVIILFITMTACKKDKTASIIPLPDSVVYTGNYYFQKSEVLIGYSDSNSYRLLPFVIDYLSKHKMQSKILSSQTKNKADIFFIVDSSLNIGKEGYKLEVKDTFCLLKASTSQGLFYGIQTLRQLIDQSPKGRLVIPTMIIEDKPRFVWRGMHLDVSRHFMPKDFVLKYIDYLAMLKMNTFHWHLVDDQGWRLEIKKYPRLTTIGAWRDSSWVGHGDDSTGVYDGKRYGGYYTQADVREIVNYATARFITIVPEIEIPGHSQASIASYPSLGCTNDTVRVRMKWGISPYIYNLDESTFQFLFDVLDETMTLFPSEYIHIGGDEALKDQWKNSPDIQKQIKKLGLKNETELQGYFTRRIEEYIRSKGRKIIGWDEILEDDIPASAAVMSWRGTKAGIEAAMEGHKVVMAPTEYCYFDYYQGDEKTEPLTIGGYIPVEKVYSFNPVPEVLNTEVEKHILGVQGNVWTEYMKQPEDVEYMIFPRMLAMAEVQWTPQDKRVYTDFLTRLKYFESFLKENKINYAKHAFR